MTDINVTLSTAATAGLGTDVYWGKVQLLIHANDQGTYTGNQNNTTNLIFIDQSSQNTNLVFSGTPAIVDSGPLSKIINTYGNTIVRPDNFKFGSYSMYYDGYGDYLGLQIPAILKDTIDDDWTVECWIYPSDVTNKQVLFSSSDTEIYIYNGMIVIDNGTTGSPATLVTNTWQHIAVACSSGIIRCYVNGFGSTPATDIKSVRNINFIATSNTQTNYYNGWMDEVRITRDVSRYYTDYTVPPAQFPEGYADGGATQVNCFVGTVQFDVSSGTAIFGVESVGSVFGDLDEIFNLGLNGSEITGNISGILSTSASVSFTISGNQSSGIVNALIKNLSLPIRSSLYPKSAFPDGPIIGDDYYSNVTLLLHGDGTNGSTTITDNSSYIRTPASVVNTSLSNIESKFGGTSIYFAGGSTTSGIQYSDSTDWQFGTADFTIEFWIYGNTNIAQTGLFAYSKNDGSFYGAGFRCDLRYNCIDFYIWRASDGTGGVNSSSANLVPNQWNHVAITRSYSTSQLYIHINGISRYTTPSYMEPYIGVSVYVPGATQSLKIGRFDNVGNLPSFVGYIDDFRITKGTARYSTTSNITVPSNAYVETPTIPSDDSYYNNVSLLLHADGSFTDKSANVKTVAVNGFIQSITNAAGSLNSTFNDYLVNDTNLNSDSTTSLNVSKFGTGAFYGSYTNTNGSYVNVNNSTEFNFGSGDFTIETWVKWTAPMDTSQWSPIIASKRGVSNEFEYIFGFFNNTVYFVYSTDGTNWNTLTSSYVPVLGNWVHVAAVRYGSEIHVYADGIRILFAPINSSTSLYSGTQPLRLFADGINNATFTGWMDEVRITKGYARYTSNDTGIYLYPGNSSAPVQTVTLVGNSATGIAGTLIANLQTASILAICYVGNLKYERAYGITGNEATGNTGTISITALLNVSSSTSVGSLTSSITDNYPVGISSTGQTGTLKYIREFQLSSSQITGIAGNLNGTITCSLTGVALSGQVDTLNYTLTDNYGSGVIATGQVGTVKIVKELALNGNQATVNIGYTLPTAFSALPGNQIDSSTGNITPTMTASYAGQVTGYGQTGTILTTNTQEKALIGVQSTLSVRNVSATNVTQLTGIESTTIVSSVSTSLTENFVNGLQINTGLGTLGKKSDGVVGLIGNQLTGTAGQPLQTLYTAITGNLITGVINTPIVQQSLNVTGYGQIGSITTSATATRSITGNLISGDVGSVKTDKIALISGNSLTGSVGDITAARTMDYASQANGYGQVGTITANSTRTVALTGVQCTGNTGTVTPTQTVDLVGNSAQFTVANITPTITANFIRGVSSSSSVGTVKAIKEYFPTGNQINTATGTIFAGPVYYRQLAGNVAYGKLYEDTQPDTNVIGTHGETYLPSSYSIKVRGSNSLITSFKCTNCNSPLIEVYYNGVDAWVKLNTPGSFEDYKAYYITKDGEYGIATDPSQVPTGAEIYNLEQIKQTELIFEMTGVYDDGANPQPFKRTYIINIIVDYSTERDLVGLGVL